MADQSKKKTLRPILNVLEVRISLTTFPIVS